ncbi:ribosome maturation factor RimM [Lichenihabitans sp. Uapishka_5]|uniref:ribosome maturation factor RimM n=1 Tax=Lichenihabitans sp. Uapishka_5 TaxID=3037302 RepID=UPI0029E8115C|nr:ribosome maturation factor RimM [Lichenihabitans sp. Uapishka_5]MDX7950113.1 ribosome maturation factor RimM [Lichenihabitans sp. Uapishka_5]
MNDSEWILIGVIGAAHGVRGELRLKSYTRDPMGVTAYAALWAGEPPRRRLIVKASRLLKDDMLVVRFEAIDGREAAQALTNLKLYVARADLPPPEDDEFYHADLIGLAAVGPDGASLGFVAAMDNFGAGDLLEIVPPRGESFYVPFTRAFVPEVDLGGRHLVLAAEALPSTEPEPDETDGD